MTWVLAVLLFAAPQPAPATAPAAAGSKLEQGQKAFSEGQFAEALKLLDAAAAEERELAALEKIHLLRGQAFAAKQDFGRAEEAFALALEANPEAALDPGKVDPSVVKLLESMRARSSGTLTFRSSPPGAHVWMDGVDTGPTPTTVTAAIGRRKLEAKWADDRYAQLEVMVRSKRETFVEFVLTEKTVEVESKKPCPEQKPPMPPTLAEQRDVQPYAAVRAGLDVNAGPEALLDVGGGVDLFQHVSIGAYVRPYRYLYLVPRVAAIWPAFEFFSLFAEAEVDIRFGKLGVALGLNVGAEYWVKPWLSAFVEVGGKHFFVNNGFVVDTRFTLHAGVRARLP